MSCSSVETRNNIETIKTDKTGYWRAGEDSEEWLGNEDGKSMSKQSFVRYISTTASQVTNEMDAETDKWNSTTSDENNDIVKRAKNMSAMAFSMYQFTKGEGSLRTTQDLFTQAEYFAEEANRLYKVVRQFSYQVGVFLSMYSRFQLTRA